MLDCPPVPGWRALDEDRGRKSFGNPFQIDGDWPRIAETNTPFSPYSLEKLAGGNYIINGEFRTASLFRKYREEISGRWFSFDVADDVDENSLVFCVRLARQRGVGARLRPTPDEIKQLIGSDDPGDMVILSDASLSQQLEEYRSLGGRIMIASPARCLQLCRHAAKVFCSEASLHWWAGFLSKGEVRLLTYGKIKPG